MASHSTKQRHDSIRKPESTSILSCFSWRSFQSPHVPFKLERFQFFPFTTGSRVCSKERFFQCVEGKGLQVIQSLFFLSSCFCVCITCVFFFQVLSQSSFYVLFCLTCFCLVIFQFCFVLFFI